MIPWEDLIRNFLPQDRIQVRFYMPQSKLGSAFNGTHVFEKTFKPLTLHGKMQANFYSMESPLQAPTFSNLETP